MKKLMVEITRGNKIESVHEVQALVMHKNSSIEFESGDAGNKEKKIFPRSAIKMLQALAFIKTGALQKFHLSEKHIALASSSHSGQAIHTELAKSWLDNLGRKAEDLVCFPHMPFGEKAAQDLIRKDLAPTRLHNNCSGKHCGLLSAIQANQWDAQHYGDYQHPVQKLLRDILSEKTHFNWHQAEWGIDGCGIPTYAVPLQALACGMSEFLRAESEEELVVQSVLARPELFAGEGEFCTRLIKNTKGEAIVKTGAEGVACGVLFKPQLSFALKVEDGAGRASEAASLYLVNKYCEQNLAQKPILNWEGLQVGKTTVREI